MHCLCTQNHDFEQFRGRRFFFQMGIAQKCYTGARRIWSQNLLNTWKLKVITRRKIFLPQGDILQDVEGADSATPPLLGLIRIKGDHEESI